MCCSESYQMVTIFWLHCIVQATLVVPTKKNLVEYGLTSKIIAYVKDEGILNTIAFALTSVVSCLPL
jgi:hypothetical protein